MRLVPTHVEALTAAGRWEHPLDGSGPVALGPLTVVIDRIDDRGVEWRVANRSTEPVAVEVVRCTSALDGADPPVRMLANGYHSWSPTRSVVLGRDEDPSAGEALEFFYDMHHARDAPARSGDVRSEMVTAFADGSGDPLVVGFLAGHDHDGTIRARPGPSGVRPTVMAEAVLGGAVLAPDEERPLHPVAIMTGPDPEALLGEWAERYGRAASARVERAFTIGWCSWYHWFDQVTEADLVRTLARAEDWPFEVYQLDDGYQSAIGDWLTTNDDFPSGVAGAADAIVATGATAGLWLAPFHAAPDSNLATSRPELLAGSPDGAGPLVNMFNEIWGGFIYGLDPTASATQDHLQEVAGGLVAAGYDYLKLDFTFGPKVRGRFADPTMTPAQRVRAGYRAIRDGAGDDTFLLGCGCPLGPVVGLVDGMRIGPDVAPAWDLDPAVSADDRYGEAGPSTRGAWRSTLLRSFLHRRLWLNDPDCVMLRSTETSLTTEQARTWARAVGLSGGMVLVSDDLDLLGSDERALLDEVVAAGRQADAEAQAGSAARVPDRLSGAEPTTISSAGRVLVADSATGSSRLA